jgi:hypothetical protein
VVFIPRPQYSTALLFMWLGRRSLLPLWLCLQEQSGKSGRDQKLLSSESSRVPNRSIYVCLHEDSSPRELTTPRFDHDNRTVNIQLEWPAFLEERIFQVSPSLFHVSPTVRFSILLGDGVSARPHMIHRITEVYFNCLSPGLLLLKILGRG